MIEEEEGDSQMMMYMMRIIQEDSRMMSPERDYTTRVKI